MKRWVDLVMFLFLFLGRGAASGRCALAKASVRRRELQERLLFEPRELRDNDQLQSRLRHHRGEHQALQEHTLSAAHHHQFDARSARQTASGAQHRDHAERQVSSVSGDHHG